MQIHAPQSLLAPGSIALLMANLALANQPVPTTSPSQSGETNAVAIHDLSTRSFDKSFESFAPAVKRAAPAVVRIVSKGKSDGRANPADGIENPLSRYSSGGSARARSSRLVERGLGSGVIVTEDGYILTNSHLIETPAELEITLPDKREFKGKVIGIDSRTDIALVKIDADHLPTVPLGDSRTVQVGDLVLAIGNPFGVGQTVTHGIVSATDRGGMGIEDYETFIQTDAAINPGNSGGALVDVTGHLIGISTALLSSSGGNLGIGFAVPSDLAHKVMSDLLKYGYVVRGFLGVETQDLTPELAKEFKLRSSAGVLVGGVTANSPAAKAGLEVGDVITQFDGSEVSDARQLKLSVAEVKPGHIVSVEVMRDGSSNSLRVTMGRASRTALLVDTDRRAYEPEPGSLQGVTMGELNSDLRRGLQIPRDVHGPVVLGVNPFSAAAEAGLRAGDVIQSINRRDIANAGEASQLTEKARDKHTLLRVWSNGGSRFILIEN